MNFHTYANGFQAVPKLGLDRIRDLLRELGDPQEKLRCVHVAGTNGKGSVCMFLDAMLRRAGYRTGRYLSPNLKKVNERIAVSGEEIPDERLNPLLDRIAAIAPGTEARTGVAPTPFEIWTAAAFTYFAEEKCDFVVLEVGMGGRFDATNVISSCAVSVITRLGMDHTAYLGNTLAEIAGNKCGIIKPGCPVVSAPQEEEALAVIRQSAREQGSALTVAAPPPPSRFREVYEIFDYAGMRDLELGLGGVHQIENAATAIEAARLLGIGEEAIRYGLSHVVHPARFERISEDPPVLFDGGHNPNGIAALTAALDRYYPGREMTVVFACMKDKEILPSLQMLNNGHRHFLFTTVQNNPRAMTETELQSTAAAAGIPGRAFPTLREALRAAAEEGRPTLVCGSLYLYGDL